MATAVSRIGSRWRPSAGSQVLIALLGVALSASWALRAWIEDVSWTECVWMFVGLAALSWAVLQVLYRWLARHQHAAARSRIPLRVWAGSSIVMLASYIITFLTNFPGCYSMDSIDSVNIALGYTELTNAHPVMYNLLVAPFVHLGDSWGVIQNGLGVFICIQMVACALVYGFVCAWLAKTGAPTAAVLFSVAFFAFDPVIARYAITMWKDIPFSLGVLLLVVMLFDIARSKGAALSAPRVIAGLAVLSLLICFMRNNGLYAMLLTIAGMVVAYRRQWRSLVPLVLTIPLLLVVTGPGYAAAGIAPSPFRESVGIPLQQISGTVASGEELAPEQYAELSNLVNVENMAELYYPISTNPVKYDPTFSNEWLDAHKAEFLRLWADIGRDHPEQYAKAWLHITQGYWNIETYDWVVSTAGIGDGNGENLLYNLTGSALFGGVETTTTQYTQLRTNTPLAPLYSLALSAWIPIALLVFRIARRERQLAIPYLPLIAIWATMLIAAPYYCEFRYMFALHIALPVVLASAFFTFDAYAQRADGPEMPAPERPRGSHSAGRTPTRRTSGA